MLNPAQAARELVAKSHTQWHEQQNQQQNKINKWNPTLNNKPAFGTQNRFGSFGAPPGMGRTLCVILLFSLKNRISIEQLRYSSDYKFE